MFCRIQLDFSLGQNNPHRDFSWACLFMANGTVQNAIEVNLCFQAKAQVTSMGVGGRAFYLYQEGWRLCGLSINRAVYVFKQTEYSLFDSTAHNSSIRANSINT